MKCTKCGKEIDNDSKFCDGCGETVIAETPAAPKKKVSKKLIAIIAVVVAAVILVVALASGGTSRNPHVIASESGSEAFGNVSFDITFDEFLDLYNACVYEDEEYDSVRQMRYLDKEDFEKSAQNIYDSETQIIMYEKKFGTSLQNLGALSIHVNSQNGKIQTIEWVCFSLESKYATQDAYDNYNFTLPASFFCFFDNDITFPYDKEVTNYANLLSELLNNDSRVIEKGDCFYQILFHESGLTSVSFSAATEDSQFFKSFTNI